jgi:L-fuculose-phosphate aldolase
MITAIGNVMRRAYELGWITTRDGNCSLRRRDSKWLYVTPSGWRKTIVHPEHMVKLEFGPDQVLDVPEGSNPSAELHMHWLLQRQPRATRAVLHLHPTFTVAAMYRGFDLQQVARHFPEIFRYTRVGSTVAAIPATTRELGDATAAAFGIDGDGKIASDIVGQMQHGVCAIGADPWSAYEHVERLEHICQMVLHSGVRPEDVEERTRLAAAVG